jgi:NAD(P)-dependent dehydrogenase (short-subunit alcohol dehydrogenase family)
MTVAAFPITLPQGAAIIIGGTGALGRAVVSAFAAAGSDIVFTYHRSGPNVDETLAAASEHGRRVDPVACDLRDASSAEKAVRSAFEKFGRIHSLVYAAGPDIPIRYVSEIGASAWRETFDIDVHGFFQVVAAAIPVLRCGGGAITAVTTTATHRYPAKDVLSAAPKAAVEALVRAVAREEGRYGVRANAVAPGWIDSGLGKRIIETEHGGKIDRLVDIIPLRRLGRPEDIAAAALYFSSEQAAYVTGQVMAVDGGWQI